MQLLQYFADHIVFFLISIFLFGLLIGSFLNVVIYRLPIILERSWRDECYSYLNESPARESHEKYNLVVPRSRCPHCDHQITALQNIPVLSFLLLKGRCISCKKPISWRYPVIELTTALLGVLVAWHFGVSWQTLAGLILIWTLMALTFIDYDKQLLPDNITLPLLWVGLFFNLFSTFTSLPSAVIGALAGYVFLWLVFQGFKLVTGKEGMGYGDFKLFAALGAWLGYEQLPFIILTASVVGAITGIALMLIFGRDRTVPIPFGPFLCSAGLIGLLWGQHLTNSYLQLLRIS